MFLICDIERAWLQVNIAVEKLLIFSLNWRKKLKKIKKQKKKEDEIINGLLMVKTLSDILLRIVFYTIWQTGTFQGQ